MKEGISNMGRYDKGNRGHQQEEAIIQATKDSNRRQEAIIREMVMMQEARREDVRRSTVIIRHESCVWIAFMRAVVRSSIHMRRWVAVTLEDLMRAVVK